MLICSRTLLRLPEPGSITFGKTSCNTPPSFMGILSALVNKPNKPPIFIDSSFIIRSLNGSSLLKY